MSQRQNPYRPPDLDDKQLESRDHAEDPRKKQSRTWIILGIISMALISLGAISAPTEMVDQLVSLAMFSVGLCFGVAAAFSHGNQYSDHSK